MKPLFLIAQDLYSYQELNLDFKPYYNGTTMILGKNLDMDSANGAGKSAILRLIYLSLFGKDVKGVAYDKIVREGSTGGSLVSFSFEDNSSIFRIVRWKNFKKNNSLITLCNGKIPSGSGVEFSVDGIAFNVEKDSAAVEEMIQSKIGMNGKIFLNSILTQQKKDNNFLEQSDGDKKELLSNIFDLEFYEKALKIVKGDLAKLQEQIAVFKNKKELFEKQLESEYSNIANIEKKIIEENDFKKTKISSLTESILKLNKEINAAEEDIEKLKIKDISEIKKNLEQELLKKSKLEKEVSLENELIKNKSEKENTIKTLIEYKEKYQKELEILNTQLTELTKEIDSFDRPLNIENIKEQLRKVEETQGPVVARISELKAITLPENRIIQEKTTIENNITQYEKEISKNKIEIAKIEEETKCTECLRIFKEGESSALDNLLNTKKEHILALEKKLNDSLLNLTSLSKKLETIIFAKNDLKKEEELLVSIQENINTTKIKYEQQVSLHKQISIKNTQKEELSNRIIKIKEDINKIDIKHSQSLSFLKNLEPLFIEIEQVKIKYVEQTNKVNQLNLELNSLEVSNKNVESLISSFNDKKEYLNAMKKELSSITDNSSPLAEVLSSSKQKTINLSKEIEDTSKNLEIFYEQIKYLNFWEIGFSKTGIRSFILDDIINILNFKTKENLDILSDRTLSLLFQPEHKNQKGIVSNKISTLMYVNGVERVFELNSGGEAQRLSLAVDLAISDIAESRAGSNFNMKFLDEPFDGIDTNGQIKALALFNKLSQTRNGFFLISHDKEMQAFCDNTIYILKEKDISRIVDKETFMKADSKN